MNKRKREASEQPHKEKGEKALQTTVTLYTYPLRQVVQCPRKRGASKRHAADGQTPVSYTGRRRAAAVAG